ncbi:MAG: hypothetical protein ACI8XB_000659 [Patiriisocius sp.]|jgi:uncharacterized protein (TIGR02453 family)
MKITKQHFTFLKSLAKNNNREWFMENKKTFDDLNNEMKAFCGQIMEGLCKTDNIEKFNVFRIYRDVRFSKNKTPYKNHLSGYFRRATAHLRGGYYLHIESGNTFVGGGFYSPSKEDLLRIRQEIEQDDKEMRAILKNPKFKKNFGALLGEELKTAPRDFDKEHKAIDLIRKKQFYVARSFTDKEVLSKDFDKEVVKTFEALRPFFNFMSETLTTDLNGISVLD